MTAEEQKQKLIEMGVTVIDIKTVQRRKHRKARINKKWLKRYGKRFDLYRNGELVGRDVDIKMQGTSSTEYAPRNYKPITPEDLEC